MSVTTSARMNPDQFGAQIPGGAYSKTGARLQDAAPKTISANGMTDAALQTAINTATAAFIDREANAAALVTKGAAALTANATYLASAAYPTGTALTTTQLTTIVRAQRVQIDLLTKECNALIRLALSLLDTVSDT